MVAPSILGPLSVVCMRPMAHLQIGGMVDLALGRRQSLTIIFHHPAK
jgi:hypothetical protein